MKLKQFFRPLWASRASYALQGLVFDHFEKISNYSQQKRSFLKRTGYALDLQNPKSFNQKVCWRKIYDRNPLLPILADKYRVRDYLKNTLGQDRADKILIPLLYVTDIPETIPFDELSGEYIIKANHGSGTNIIVSSDEKPDRRKIISACKEWLRHPYGFKKHEWAYRDIPRKIIVERLMRDETGNLPADYKFHMFHGKCEMVQINQGHFADKDNRTLSLYDQDWKKFDVFWEFKSADHVIKPDNFDAMLELAKELSEPFDYVRIDLYSIRDQIYFGEFTFYPTSGQASVKPKEFDFSIGEKWTIEQRQSKGH